MNDDDLDRELDAWLDDFDSDSLTLSEANDPPDVSKLDERKVNAMLAKRARLVDEERRVVACAEERIEPIITWRDDRVAGINRQLAWLDRGIEQFARQALPAMNRRSLPLAHGTLKLTAPGQPSLVVDDLGEFVAWATDSEHPDRDELLKRDVQVVKSDAKKAFRLGPKIDERCTEDVDVFAAVDADGAIVPGVTLTKPALDRFGIDG